MKRYICYGPDEVEIVAATPQDAAREYVEGCDWGTITSTIWIDVRVVEVDDDGEEIEDHGRITVALDPEAPDCIADGHDWCSPHSVLGGCKSNPGVWGHGGGVVIYEVCRHCGCYRVTDTWAQRPDTGEQGLESVEYRDADDASLAWAREE